jgi:hypothetical protein
MRAIVHKRATRTSVVCAAASFGAWARDWVDVTCAACLCRRYPVVYADSRGAGYVHGVSAKPSERRV